MPNFIAKSLKEISLPFKSGEICLKERFKGRVLDLVLVENGGEEFFMSIKPKKSEYIIKGEKITRPAKIGLLEQVLKSFENNFCGEIKSESFIVNKNSLIKKESPIKSENEILALIKESKYKEIHLEIGFGSGRHLLFLAKNNPEILFIGIEIYKPAMEQVAKLAIAQKLENIALTNCDARTFLDMFSSNSLDFIYLHFPVPWDDAPHRRVISDEFLLIANRVLKNGGIFELRSDSENYAKFSIDRMLEFKKAKISIKKNENLAVTSKYEARWQRQEKDIFEVQFVCPETSENENINYDFTFEKANYDKILHDFKNLTLKFDDYFVHFEDIFVGQDKFFLKLSFGAFASPESHYILITPQSARYYFRSPLCTKANLKSHKKIKEILSNE